MKATLSVALGAMILGVGQTAHASGKQAAPDYSTMERGKVPEQYKWKTEDIYATPEAWSQDRAALDKLVASVEPLTKGWTDSAGKMFALVDLLTSVRVKAYRLASYASLMADTDMGNPEYQKMRGDVQNAMVQLEARLSFMKDDILKLGEDKVAQYVSGEPRLAPYEIGFRRILRMREHVLPADESRIVALTGLFSGAPSKASGLLNNLDIPDTTITLSDGAKVVLNTANYSKYRSSPVTADRRAVMETFWNGRRKFENTLAALLDGSLKAFVFRSRVEKYKTCLDYALYDDDIPPEVYHNLVRTMRDNLDPLHRLLRLRKKMMGLDDFRYGDVYAPPVKEVDKTYALEESRDMIMASMKPLGAEYTGLVKRAFDERWMDVYPNKGKQSGAYSSGVYGVHPFMKLNTEGDFSSVSTMAHELGHAMHSYYSQKTQHFVNSGYPIFLAEVASTFNEYLLIRSLLKTEKDDRFKLYLLNEYLERMRGTLYRQTLFADFELASHEAAEAGQTLTPDWFNRKYLELTRLYYGHDKGVVNVEDYIRNEWSGIPHFFRDFYVFQYSTGIVAAMALADRVLNGGEPERAAYFEFLKAGDTKFPLATLRDAGVDMSVPAPVEAAVRQFDEMVGEMEAIVARLEKRGE